MFNTGLGEALYAGSFKGGREGRRRALAREVGPVLVDMLLLAARADAFWPTPGSTMSTVSRPKTDCMMVLPACFM